MHIRSVLTKAELESLPVEGRVKEDAEKGKVRGRILCLLSSLDLNFLPPRKVFFPAVTYFLNLQSFRSASFV